LTADRAIDRRGVLRAAGTASIAALLGTVIPGAARAGLERGFHFVRIQAGPDGRSYIDEYDPQMPGESPPVIYRAEAVSVALLTWPGGTAFNFGPTHGGVRRLLVTATGLTVTIVDDGSGAGTSYHPLKPGSVMFAEDFSGRGHRGQVFADEDAIVFQVDLAG
jgi:hypothetical protein